MHVLSVFYVTILVLLILPLNSKAHQEPDQRAKRRRSLKTALFRSTDISGSVDALNHLHSRKTLNEFHELLHAQSTAASNHEADTQHRNLESDESTYLLEITFEEDPTTTILCQDLRPVYHLCPIASDVQVEVIEFDRIIQHEGHVCSTYANFLSPITSENVEDGCLVTVSQQGVQGMKLDQNSTLRMDFTVGFCKGSSSEHCAEVVQSSLNKTGRSGVQLNESSARDFDNLTCVSLDKGETYPREPLMEAVSLNSLSKAYHRNLRNIDLWTGCYEGIETLDSDVLELSIGVSLGSELYHSDIIGESLQGAMKWIESIVAEANVIYTQQLRLKLVVHRVEIISRLSYVELLPHMVPTSKEELLFPSWDNPDCVFDIYQQLQHYLYAEKAETVGLWHLFDNCYLSGKPVGIAYRDVLCSDFWNVGMTHVYSLSQTWLTFAHEIGHNLGARHSFEEGMGNTGGIMDYGSKVLGTEYQFNGAYRFGEICAAIRLSLLNCPTLWRGERVGTMTSICGNGNLETGEECECEQPLVSCECCENCRLRAFAQCDPIHNECCGSDCSLETTQKMCHHSEGVGYCRNGFCSTPRCKEYGFGEFCGLHQSNPCKISCEVGNRCHQMEGWTSNGQLINEIRDTALCSTIDGTLGTCQNGRCVAETTASPTDGLLQTSSMTPTLSPSQPPIVLTARPTALPTSQPTMLPSALPTAQAPLSVTSSCCESLREVLYESPEDEVSVTLNFLYKSPLPEFHEVCGETLCVFKSFPDAQSECEKVGARLCSYAEVTAQCIKNSGCRVNSEHVWTKTACDDGNIAVNGKHGQNVICASPEEEYLVACCAETC